MTKFKMVPVAPTRKMILELMATGLRHAEYKDGCSPTVNEMAQGYQFMLAAAPSPWVSVEELLPEDETDVLVRGESFGRDIFTVAGRFYGDWMSQETEEIISFEPTHWMPLPTPPEKSE